MNDGWTLFCGFSLGVMLTLIGASLFVVNTIDRADNAQRQLKTMQREAVESGHAKWGFSNEGEAELKWK